MVTACHKFWGVEFVWLVGFLGFFVLCFFVGWLVCFLGGEGCCFS